MIVAVLDTNVLVSAFHAHGTVPARVIDAWRQGAFHLVVSEHILDELAETWRDPYWQARFSESECTEAITLLRHEAIVTSLPVEVVGVATHPVDDLILATAVAAEATYLVTCDRQLRAVGAFQGVTILSPREFLDQLLPLVEYAPPGAHGQAGGHSTALSSAGHVRRRSSKLVSLYP